MGLGCYRGTFMVCELETCGLQLLFTHDGAASSAIRGSEYANRGIAGTLRLFDLVPNENAFFF
jgi:hypothetical protein